MHKISKNIFYEDGYQGVTLGAMVTSHGTIYVDAPLRVDDARTWRSMLLNQRGGNHRLLVNLDAHPDRTLGARLLDCTVVAHHKTAQVFRNRPTIFKGQSVETGSAWEEYSEAIGMRWLPPDITFSSLLSLFWGNSEVVVEHHPGPTAGACWVVIPSEQVVFLGDALVVDQPPFLASADLAAWLESMEILLTQYKDFKLIGGRGGVASLANVATMQQGLKSTLRNLEKLAKRHAPPEATQDLLPTLMQDFKVPPEKQERFMLRLRYGLYQYHARRYRPSSSLENFHPEESEQ